MKTMIIFIVSLFIGINSFEQNTASNVHHIGDKFDGGIIFYIDETGQHGLIAAQIDQGQSVKWGCKKKTIGASDLTDGLNNTKKIVKECGQKTAAYLCETLNLEGYTDWYLPSLEELKLIYEQRLKISGLQAGNYCSSSD